jgi:hypothetical protein
MSRILFKSSADARDVFNAIDRHLPDIAARAKKKVDRERASVRETIRAGEKRREDQFGTLLGGLFGLNPFEGMGGDDD